MWRTVKLGEICNVRRGTTITKKNTVAGVVPVIGGGTKPTYFHNEANRDAGCITVSGSGASAGFVNYWDTPIFASDCSTVEIKTDELLQRFVYYFMQSQQQYIYENFRSGAAQPHVYAKDIATLEIPVITPAEQQRIVAKLDAAFAEIDEARDANYLKITEMNTLSNLVIDEWLTKFPIHSEIGKLCDFLNGYAFKSGDAVEQSNVQLLRMGNLYGNQLDLNRKPIFYPNNFADEYQKYVLNCGDIIMTLTGTVGKEDYGYAIEVPKTEKKLLLNQRILKFHNIDTNLILPQFFLHVLHSQQFLKKLYKTANGTRQANLSSDTIKKLEIPLPSIGEQEEFLYKIKLLLTNKNIVVSNADKNVRNCSQIKSAILAQELESEAA